LDDFRKELIDFVSTSINLSLICDLLKVDCCWSLTNSKLNRMGEMKGLDLELFFNLIGRLKSNFRKELIDFVSTSINFFSGTESRTFSLVNEFFISIRRHSKVRLILSRSVECVHELLFHSLRIHSRLNKTA
jgi:hypothetical protein